MPIVKNVSPKGDLELVLHQQDDEDGNVLSGQRIVVVAAGESVEVSQREAKVLDHTNWEIQKPSKAKAEVTESKEEAHE